MERGASLDVTLISAVVEPFSQTLTNGLIDQELISRENTSVHTLYAFHVLRDVRGRLKREKERPCET